jgi:3-hydroxyacyl-CoA dehydrogenase
VNRLTVAVVGAGTMGAGIAQVAAVAGHPVLVYDVMPGAAVAAIGKIRERVARRGRIRPALTWPPSLTWSAWRRPAS